MGISDFDDDEVGFQVAYLLKDKNGYDYIEEIEDPKTLKAASEAVREMIKNVS